MTIESPLALSTRPTERSEKMYREGVAYASPCHTTVPAQVHNTPCLPVSFPKGVNQPDTPEQYMQDPCLTVASPSSVLMYEQDVSDMQKSLLSPGSNHGNLAESFQTYGISQGRLSDIQHNIDDVEQSFNLEINSLESSKVLPWSPQVLDTGQTQFKVEDVMISHNVNEGPTLAELNKMDSAIFDDISNMITNDSVHVVKAPVSVTATETQESKKVLSNVKDSAVKQQDCNMVASASTAVVDSRPVVSTATVSRFTTCTITSPTQTIKTESVSPSFAPPIISIYNTPTPALQHHTHLPNNPTFYAVPFAPAPNFLSVTTTTVQQPSLQNLLASPVHNIKQEAVPGNMREVETNVVKSEAVSKQLDSPESGNSNSSINTKWEEIKRYLEAEQATTDPPVKRIKTEPSDAVYKPEDVSQEMNSDSDSDFDFSDTESIGSHCSFVEELLVGGKKEKRYFWQYNTQAKGPKGKRLCKTVDPNDPHVLNDFEDPVFDPDITDAKYKHNGRARKGDGNDITPSPYKLYQIGNQLNKLNKKINEMAPSGETSVPTRNKTRREKNKYASRACRLKKKAQHEANKIKLYGLDTEHTQLMMVLDLIRTEIHDQIKNGKKDQESLTSKLEKLIKSHLTAMIAGNTAEYVNCVLEHVVNGDKTGGLNLHSQP